MDKVWHVASIYPTDIFRCWLQRQGWNFKTSWLDYPKMRWWASMKEFSFKSMQTGIRLFGIGCARQGLSRRRETLSRVLWVVSCSKWICQGKQVRIISTGHKMTLVNGFRAHHNGFVEADFQVVAEGLVFLYRPWLEKSWAPCVRNGGASLRSRDISSFPIFLKATTAPVRSWESLWISS